MSVLPQTMENLAAIGVNIDITDNSFVPQTLENLVAMVRSKGSHITINAAGYIPATLERLAMIGGSNLTLRF